MEAIEKGRKKQKGLSLAAAGQKMAVGAEKMEILGIVWFVVWSSSSISNTILLGDGVVGNFKAGWQRVRVRPWQSARTLRSDIERGEREENLSIMLCSCHLFVYYTGLLLLLLHGPV